MLIPVGAGHRLPLLAVVRSGDGSTGARPDAAPTLVSVNALAVVPRDVDMDDAVTRREIDRLIGVGSEAAARVAESAQAALERAENLRDERWRAHDREHKMLAEATALGAANDASGVAKALDAVAIGDAQTRDALRTALADHHREHLVHETSHAREHTATDLALTKAESATDKRFESVNEFREQLRTQAGTFVSRDVIEALTKEMDRRFAEVTRLTQERYEANRASIVAIEKGDVKQEGKGIGQAWVIAAIVTVATLIATILGIVIVIANFATSHA